MNKKYVSKTLSEFLNESSSIMLKRKYGSRPQITVSKSGPLRNQVLSFVAESGTVSKRDLKQFIMGLKEGGTSSAAALMFLKRNGRYFLTESKNGITYFKLSKIGQRLLNHFTVQQNQNVSETMHNDNANNTISKDLQNKLKNNEDIDFDDEGDDLDDVELEADDVEVDNDEVPADEIEFDDDERFDDEDEREETEVETDQFEYEEDDDKIVLTYYKNPEAHEEEEAEEGEENFDHNEVDDEDLDDEDVDFDDEDLEDLEAKDFEDEETEDLDDEDEDISEEDDKDYEDEEFDENEIDESDDDLTERPLDDPRKYDFKDKGRPGLNDVDEAAKAKKVSTSRKNSVRTNKGQFEIHPLAGTKTSKKLGGKLPNYANLLENVNNLMSAEEFENFIQELIDLDDFTKASKRLKALFDANPDMNMETGDIAGRDLYKKGLDMFREYYHGYKRSIGESISVKNKMKKIVEDLKSKRMKRYELLEAEDPDESDELKDEDLDKINTDEVPEETPEETLKEQPVEGEEDVEKVEITEFIITVDDVDAAIEELAELGVTAERVPLEKPVEEVPAEVEEPESKKVPEKTPEEKPKEEPLQTPEEKDRVAKESLQAFVKNLLTEAEEDEQKPDDELDLGSSDELGLGDQGEEAAELEEKPEGELTEPATEFEPNKIKVPAEEWPKIKPWLEEKNVDIKEMFGGDIEMEEVSPEEAEEVEEPEEEIADDDIDFSGISDDEDEKIKDEDKEDKEEKE